VTAASRAIVSENLWRAQRDGVRADFIDEKSARSVPCSEYLVTLLEMIAPDEAELGCELEVKRTRHIVAHGTSDRQLAILTQSPLEAVVDWIASVTSKAEAA
jgi:glutamate---cysteine ligase / carboxylate-amine ligase